MMNNNDENQFVYVKSCQLPINMRMKINMVDKQRPPPSSLQILKDPLLEFSPWAHPTKVADLMVQCQVLDGDQPFSLTAQTTYVEMSTRWDWYEWLELPVLVCDLPRNSQLLFTVWDSKHPGKMFCVGIATVAVYDAYGEMNTGKKDLRVIEDNKIEDSPEVKKIFHRLNELDTRLSKYERGQTAQIDWMDRLAFREIGELTEKLKKESGSLFLSIQFPTFKNGIEKLSVLFYEQGYLSECSIPRNPKYCKQYDPSAGMENIIEKKHLALARSLRSGFDDRDIRPNAEVKKKLIEIMEYPPTTVLTGMELDLVWKHRYFLSEHKAGLTKFVKCINWSNADQKKEALQLLNSWAVLDAENALELLGPSFTVPEVRQYAVRRLGGSSDEDLQLYLLQLVQALKYEPFSPDTFTFNEMHYSDDFDVIVRNNHKLVDGTKKSPLGLKVTPAEKRTLTAAIAEATDSTTPPKDRSKSTSSFNKSGDISASAPGGLLELLVDRATRNLCLATALFWFLKVEISCDDASNAQGTTAPASTATVGGATATRATTGGGGTSYSVCQYALERLITTLLSGDKTACGMAHDLQHQDKLVHKLVGIVEEMRTRSLSREQKVRFLRHSLADPILGVATLHRPIPLPLDPTVTITGLDVDSVHVFKSALEPCKLSFTTLQTTNLATDDAAPSVPGRDERLSIVDDNSHNSEDNFQPNTTTTTTTTTTPDENQESTRRISITNTESLTPKEGDLVATTPPFPPRVGAGVPYHTIFKVGDDLRQDQLILQLLTLLDGLLLRENLDLKLTPYRVLATAHNHGFVQFIEASVVADILREDGSILNFLRKHQPDPDAPMGVSPQALDTYIRSCAGYCIITYLLGVGDRHHDNLMLTKDGRFFHIDFGYILGRDPKPLPPLIKLSREITDGFGGQNSEQYQQFRHLCRTTFLSLRRHANLVLNLFSLMVGASIPDIALEPEKAVRKVEERLHLDLTDEQASSKILSVLHESANAVFGAVAENLHKFTQYIRN